MQNYKKYRNIALIKKMAKGSAIFLNQKGKNKFLEHTIKNIMKLALIEKDTIHIL